MRPTEGVSAVCLLLSVLLVLGTPASVVGQTADTEIVRGRPDVEAYLPENVVTPGAETSLNVVLVNDARLLATGPANYEQLVQTARTTLVEVEADDAPLTVLTTETPVGDLPDGRNGPFPFRVRVDPDASPGTYELPVTIRYEYTKTVSITNNRTRLTEVSDVERTSVTVRVDDRARFELVDTESDAPIGGTGPVTLSLRNAGSDTARGATVTVGSEDPELTFGEGTPTADSYVGRWEPGETRRVTYRAGFTDDALDRSYALNVAVSYRGRNDTVVRSDPLAAGVRPAGRVAFAFENLTSDLRVGERGRVSGTVVSTGSARADNAVVVLAANSSALTPGETDFPVGDLPPGERRPFSFVVDTSDGADAGPRRLSLAVEYRAGDGSRRVSDPVAAGVDVGPERDLFAVEPVNATFSVDSSGTLVVNVTNTGGEPLTDVQARLNVSDPPLTSDDPTAFEETLTPGETVSMAFELTVSDDAVPKNQSASLAFTYEDAAGDAQVSEPIAVPVEIVPEPGTPASTVAVVAAVLVLVGVGVWWWRRR
ncbi:MAG: COG1361 S-layer family protein [Halobacteriota archaeon]